MAGNKSPQHEHEGRLPEAPDPQSKHELSDVDAWAVSKFGIALVLLCIATLLLLFGLFRYFQGRETANQPPANPGMDAVRSTTPPEPRLQSTPVVDLKQIRDAEDQILGSYAWIDQQKGVVRIPVDRAMELLAQRGLPSRPQAGPQSGAADVSVPTESGLGLKQQADGPTARGIEALQGAAAAEGQKK